MQKMAISRGQKDKEQVNRERALFLAAYEYSNTNEKEEIDVKDFFQFLKESFSQNVLVRGKFKLHQYSDLEEMVGDLHELDHQGKILLEQGMTTFTII